jgi:hypothetical protein
MSNVVSNLLIKLVADFGAAKGAKAEVNDLKKSLANLSKSGAGTDKVAKSIKEIGAAAKGLDIGWSEKFSREINQLALGGDKLAKVKREWKELVSTIKAKDLHASMPRLDAWEASTIASLRKVEKEVTKMRGGAHASGVAGATGFGGVMAVGRHMLGPIASGYAAYHLGRETIAATAGYQRENYRGSLSGMSPDEIKASAGAASKLSQKYRSVGQREVMEHLRKLRGTLGDFHHAQEMIESVVQAQAVLSSGPGGKEGAIRDLDQITKGLEGAGFANDPGKFGRMLNAFVRAKNLFGETITGEDFRTYIQRSKSSKFGLSEDYLAGVVPTMIQHEGANQFGTAQATAFNALIGGRQTKAAKAKLKSFGLLGKDGEVIDKQLLISDPDKWAIKNLKPRMAAAGMKLDTEAGSSEREKAVDFLMKAFSARNTGEFFASLLANEKVINKDRANLKDAAGTDQAANVIKNDPYQAWRAVKAQSENLAQNMLQSGGVISKSLSAIADMLGAIATAGRGDHLKNAPPDERSAYKAFSPSSEGFMQMPLSDADRRKAEAAARSKLDGTRNNFNFSDMAKPTEATAAGAQSGSGFRQGLKSELDQAEQDVADSMGRIKGMLNFNASPTITPKVNVPAGAGNVPGNQSSIANTSRQLARRIDQRSIGNFTDTEYG